MLFFGLDNNQLNSNTSYLNEIEDTRKIYQGLIGIVGVVEVGLFIDMAAKIIIGDSDGSYKVI